MDPQTLTKRIHFTEKHPKFEDMICSPLVRKRVAEMMAEAAEKLPAGIDIKLFQGFRPLAYQRQMYEFVKSEFAAKHPEWSKATLHRVVNQLTAPPDDKCPPPHSTGAAFDLCLVDAASGADLDMTSPFEWDPSSAPTALKGLSPTASANRKLLIETLTSVGLTNYIGEWWHWSYGDSGWALRVGAPFAIYDRLPEA